MSDGGGPSHRSGSIGSIDIIPDELVPPGCHYGPIIGVIVRGIKASSRGSVGVIPLSVRHFALSVGGLGMETSTGMQVCSRLYKSYLAPTDFAQ
jgi:hypothetical protein